MFKNVSLLAVLSFCLLNIAVAQTNEIFEPSQKLSGVVFSDYYTVLGHHNEDLEGENGFWLRRLYLTYDSNFAKNLIARARLEMNSPGDFSTNRKLDPVIKDLYLNWAMNENHSLIAGISSTPTWGLIEKVWGYRPVEKSPADLHKLGSSRDFGLALRGQLGESGKLKYHAMLGNGSSNGAETNKWKKYMLSLDWWFTDNLVVQAYGEYNRTSETNTVSAVHGFLGYVSDSFNAGAMYVAQFNTEEISGADDETDTIDLVSVFTNFKMADKWKALLRADHLFTANPRGPSVAYIPFSNQAEYTFVNVGVDYEATKNVRVIPNFETVFYGDAPGGTNLNTDVIFRMTLYYKF